MSLPSGGLWSREIQQHHIRTLLGSFEHNFSAIRRNVEVANVEIRSEVGQLPLSTRLQVNPPEILVLNLSSQEYERPSSRQKGQVSSSPSQRQSRQWMRCGVRRDRFHRKRCADIGARVDNEAPIR